MPRIRSRLLALALALAPDAASACAVCIDSAASTRGFSWAFVGLMLAPFAVVAGLAGFLAVGCARGRGRPRLRAASAPRAGGEPDLDDASTGTGLAAGVLTVRADASEGR
jgi:hypothetical protein